MSPQTINRARNLFPVREERSPRYNKLIIEYYNLAATWTDYQLNADSVYIKSDLPIDIALHDSDTPFAFAIKTLRLDFFVIGLRIKQSISVAAGNIKNGLVEIYFANNLDPFIDRDLWKLPNGKYNGENITWGAGADHPTDVGMTDASSGIPKCATAIYLFELHVWRGTGTINHIEFYDAGASAMRHYQRDITTPVADLLIEFAVPLKIPILSGEASFALKGSIEAASTWNYCFDYKYE